MTTITLATAAEFAAFKQTTPRFLADFWKDNCVNCKMLELAFQKLAKTAPVALEGVVLAKLKLEDTGEDFFRANDVRQAPTLILFQDGAEVARASGFVSPEKIQELLRA